jgi:hypothetical protein
MKMLKLESLMSREHQLLNFYIVTRGELSTNKAIIHLIMRINIDTWT